MKGMFDRFLDRVENLDRDLFDPLRRSRSNFWIQKRIHDHGGREREKKYDPLQKMVSSWGGRGIVLNESGVEAGWNRKRGRHGPRGGLSNK